MPEFSLRQRLFAAAGLLLTGVAVASPWDVDMIDSRLVKAYEWRMMPAIPEGTMPRPDYDNVRRPLPAGHYQNDHLPPTDRSAPETQAMVSPYAADQAFVDQGKELFRNNCAACHGLEGKGGGPVTQFDPAKGLNRVPMPAPMLSGAGSVSSSRSDGYIYDTIRNGGNQRSGGLGMPALGLHLTSKERWAIVSYIRTLDGAAYTPPAPAPGSAP